MTNGTMLLAGLILLPVVILVTWAWFAMVRVDEDLRALGGFEGMHFEIGPDAADGPERATWPIPG